MYLLSNIAIWISIKFQRNSSFIKSVSAAPCFSLFRAWKFNVKHNTSHSIYNTERAPTIYQHPAGIRHNLLQHVQKKHHKLNHKEIPQNIWSKKWGSSWILTPQEKLKKKHRSLGCAGCWFPWGKKHLELTPANSWKKSPNYPNRGTPLTICTILLISFC